uniref:AN1-type domain-containing protein n=1 Tax=Cuerna arida TaxID=1464854 RepID=A0A1B6GBC9_9HEMI
MELPKLGERCSRVDCKQLDFLPVLCSLCQGTFCKDHSFPNNHSCTKVVDNVVQEKRSTSEWFSCHAPECKERSAVEMLCTKCGFHFCLTHRHHDSCYANQEDVLPWRLPKMQFAKAKEETDKQVEEKLKAAQKDTATRATANKIRLMKIKGKAVGDNKIPTTDRIFFTVHPPLNNSSQTSRPLFVSKTWTVGRSLDFFAKKLNTENNNAKPGAPKLKIFRKEDGVCLPMDAVMGTLLQDCLLSDGEPLILEYVTTETVAEVSETLLYADKYNK